MKKESKRVKQYRERQKAAGLVRVEVYIPEAAKLRHARYVKRLRTEAGV
tara:strand:- start:175 stop:321 length:147 start_codon:yes stop_codon:yes gene_type:complete